MVNPPTLFPIDPTADNLFSSDWINGLLGDGFSPYGGMHTWYGPDGQPISEDPDPSQNSSLDPTTPSPQVIVTGRTYQWTDSENFMIMQFVSNRGLPTVQLTAAGGLPNLGNIGFRLSLKAFFAANAVAKANLKDNLKRIFGNIYSDAEMETLANEFLDALTPGDYAALQSIKAAIPQTLTQAQKTQLDLILSRLPNDALTNRARNSYTQALASGTLIVR